MRFPKRSGNQWLFFVAMNKCASRIGSIYKISWNFHFKQYSRVSWNKPLFILDTRVLMFFDNRGPRNAPLKRPHPVYSYPQLHRYRSPLKHLLCFLMCLCTIIRGLHQGGNGFFMQHSLGEVKKSLVSGPRMHAIWFPHDQFFNFYCQIWRCVT